jgi:hypothetical protein
MSAGMQVPETFDHSARNFIGQYRTSLAMTQDTTEDLTYHYNTYRGHQL